MDSTVIALVGMPGAGKSFCVDYLTRQGFPKVYFGGVIVDEVKRRGMEVNEANERVVREELREAEGPQVIAKRILVQIDELAGSGHPVIIADGLYSWTEYKMFKERFGDKAVIIAIAAPRSLRHERLATRAVRPLTSQQVTGREYAEIEKIEKGGPIANADYTIANNDTTDDMILQLEKVLARAGISLAAAA